MKRSVGAVLLLVLGLTLPASAGHTETFTQQGTILVPGPQTRTYGGISEILSPCGGSIDPDVPDGLAQGVDGFWFALPAGLGGHDATLSADGANNVDAWFYDESCGLIKPATDPDAYKMATDAEVEQGKIPAAAAYVVVDLYLGAAATFTFTVPA